MHVYFCRTGKSEGLYSPVRTLLLRRQREGQTGYYMDMEKFFKVQLLVTLWGCRAGLCNIPLQGTLGI